MSLPAPGPDSERPNDGRVGQETFLGEGGRGKETGWAWVVRREGRTQEEPLPQQAPSHAASQHTEAAQEWTAAMWLAGGRNTQPSTTEPWGPGLHIPGGPEDHRQVHLQVGERKPSRLQAKNQH